MRPETTSSGIFSQEMSDSSPPDGVGANARRALVPIAVLRRSAIALPSVVGTMLSVVAGQVTV